MKLDFKRQKIVVVVLGDLDKFILPASGFLLLKTETA